MAGRTDNRSVGRERRLANSGVFSDRGQDGNKALTDSCQVLGGLILMVEFAGLRGAVAAFAVAIPVFVTAGTQGHAAPDTEGLPLPRVAQADATYHQAPVVLDRCMDSAGLILERPGQRPIGFRIRLHAGSRYSLRRDSWAALGMGVAGETAVEVERDSPSADTAALADDWVIRSQIEIRLVLKDRERQARGKAVVVPLLFRANPPAYMPACAGTASSADRPHHYPTVHLTMRPAPQDLQRAPYTRTREALITLLREQAPNRFRPRDPSPGNWTFSWSALDDAPGRLTYGALVGHALGAATPAFLDSWPGRVEIALDGVGALPDLADLVLEHPGHTSDESTMSRELSVILPPVLIGAAAPEWMKESSGACPGPWYTRSDDDRVLSVSCSRPPPYRVRLGRAAPVSVKGTVLLLDPEVLHLDLPVPLAPGWPHADHGDGQVVLHNLRISDLLAGQARVSMFPDADEDTATWRVCSAGVPADPTLLYERQPAPLLPPCRVLDVPDPSAWRPHRIWGGRGPELRGCLSGSPTGRCVLPADAEPRLTIEWGPGWSPFRVDSPTVLASGITERLRPAWPYAGWAPVRDADGAMLEDIRLTKVRYCTDARATLCCDGDTLPRRAPEGDGPLLPTLAEAGCRADDPLPVFGVATFERFTALPSRMRFNRYWVIGHTEGRPYVLDAAEALKAIPVDVAASLERLGADARAAVFPSLKACRSAGRAAARTADVILETGDRPVSISLPAFAVPLTESGAAGPCVEAGVRGGETPRIVFLLETPDSAAPPAQEPTRTVDATESAGTPADPALAAAAVGDTAVAAPGPPAGDADDDPHAEHGETDGGDDGLSSTDSGP